MRLFKAKSEHVEKLLYGITAYLIICCEKIAERTVSVTIPHNKNMDAPRRGT